MSHGIARSGLALALGLSLLTAGHPDRASAAFAPDTERQAAQRDSIRNQLPITTVNDIRASCAEGTRPKLQSGDLPLGEQCVEALARSVTAGYTRDYYTWEYGALEKLAGVTSVAPTNEQADELAAKLDAAAKDDKATVDITFGEKGVKFPVLHSRAFDAAYVTAYAAGYTPPTKGTSMSSEALRAMVENCYQNQAGISLSRCRAAARELAARAVARDRTLGGPAR